MSAMAAQRSVLHPAWLTSLAVIPLAVAPLAVIAASAPAQTDDTLLGIRFRTSTPTQEATATKAPHAKISPNLAQVALDYRRASAGNEAAGGGFKPHSSYVRVYAPPRQASSSTEAAGHPLVAVEAVASGNTDDLLLDFQALGCTRVQAWRRMVSARCPIPAIERLRELESLNFARPVMAKTQVGDVSSEGEVVMGADIARGTFGVDGSGLVVGVLSDSYDACAASICATDAATDVASGDLPTGVVVLDDLPAGNGIDEGRGMMQLIFDVAPGADLAFHTAFNGMADFALGIIELAQQAQCDVIVDDIIYFAEPMFADGIVAQAVDFVKDRGVAYFSAAGNNARNAYAARFAPSGRFEPFFGGELHDFDPGPAVGVFQAIRVPPSGVPLSFQWDEPYASVSGAPGSQSDYDIFLCATPDFGNCFGSAMGNIGADPIEIVFAPSGEPAFELAYLALSRSSGQRNAYLTYVALTGSNQFSIAEFDNARGTIYGHANASGAMAVGAVAYYNTPAFFSPTPVLNDFSSAGGTPILLDTEGGRALEHRFKPDVSAPDFANTTFFAPGFDLEGDGFPNFSGTSAAAPHAAAVAALMLDTAGGKSALLPDEIYGLLEASASDILRRSPKVSFPADPGFRNLPFGCDRDSGCGLVDANAAITAVRQAIQSAREF